MSTNNSSPQTGESFNNNASQGASQTDLQGHNPAIAKYSKLQLHPDSIVKPDLFTLYFGFFGTRIWKNRVANTITDRVENHYVLTGRAPTQAELDAHVEHGTRSLYYARTGVPVGSFLGTALLYRQARKSPHFPQNPTPANMLAALRGAMTASTAGSILGPAVFRVLFLVTLGGMMSSFSASAYSAMRTLSDPRLKGFLAEMRGRDPDDVRKRKMQAASERLRYMRRGEQDIGTQMRKGMGGSDGFAGDSGYEQELDVQPPNSYSEYEGSGGGAAGQYGADESQMRKEAAGAVWARGRGAQPEQKSSLDFLDEDDASPTAAEYRDTNIDGSSSGSAWDRLRQQNSGGRFQPRQPGVPSHPYAGVYARGKQDRDDSNGGSERNSAQAEFDRLIDSERNAGNGGSQSRGWGS
ncbi:uncharacterized protein N7515_009692 [Penicillium bovifimosum]|uniref:Endo-1,3(4)-beta-glucanase n=1 Tax=Penicillium bovifimosum TaxID=126998 RepID=A0A9W9GHC7_9EURO|nr:uncharacterized protein N7515_009692 [Penicillium bovifimosum]KAJ5120304.1 hypothetical protein N7515_009692 [Penicillium bovifimosum]